MIKVFNHHLRFKTGEVLVLSKILEKVASSQIIFLLRENYICEDFNS